MKQRHDLKVKKMTNYLSYVEILNLFLAQNHAALIRKDCTRINEHLRRLASNATKSFSRKRGRNYDEFVKQRKSIAIRNGEVLKVGDLEKDLGNLKEKVNV